MLELYIQSPASEQVGQGGDFTDDLAEHTGSEVQLGFNRRGGREQGGGNTTGHVQHSGERNYWFGARGGGSEVHLCLAGTRNGGQVVEAKPLPKCPLEC